MRKYWAVWVIFLAPLALMLPGIGSVFFSNPQAQFSDLLIAHEPYMVFLRRAWLEWGQFPLWSSLILSGHPLAGNPLGGLWYPPGWLALFLPLPWGFNLLAALHLGWGGAGAYRLLRLEGAGLRPALFGGLAFALLPKLFAHLGAGHITLVYALAWTPWLLAETRSASLLRRALISPAIILALITLADPRWTPYAGGLWVFYALGFAPGRLWQRGLRSLGQALLAALLSAPLLAPLFEMARLSTRAAMSAEEATVFALPPSQLLGLIFPAFGGFHEWALYPGAGVLVLAVLALVFWQGHQTPARFWLAAAGVGLLLAFGPALPGYGLLAGLPGFDLLRVPARALFLLGLGLALAAAHAGQYLLDGPSESERRRSGLVLAALGSTALIFTAGVGFLVGGLPLNFAWGGGMLIVTSIWTGLFLARRWQPGWWWAGLLVLCLLDWGVTGRSFLNPRPVEQVYSTGEPAAAYLAAQPGRFRVYLPSYSLPQHVAARYGLELADGVDPLQISAYWDYMELASGVPAAGYSVTLPPFAEGEVARANAAYLPDPQRLGLLNVHYVAAEYDLTVDGLDLIETFGQTRLYANRYVRPRAWLQPLDALLGEQAQAVDSLEWTPNQIRLAFAPAGEPRLLALAELRYPGWFVQIDGAPTRMAALDVPLRAVSVPPGAREVVFTFRPLSVYAGLGLALMAALFLIFRVVRYAGDPNRASLAAAGSPEPAAGGLSLLPGMLTGVSRFRLGLILLTVLLTSLPYLLGYASQGQDWRFSGFIFGVEDGNSYIAKMLSGAEGNWLFRTSYTTDPQPGVLALLPYLLLGKLAGGAGLHSQLTALFHLFRVFAAGLAILATADFLAIFLPHRATRRWALLLAVLGGGLGWLLVGLGQTQWLGSLPLDFISPETFGFISLYGLPHLALARALLLWGLVLYLRAPQAAEVDRRAVWAWDSVGVRIGLLWLLLGLAQPLTVLIGWLVLALHLAASGAALAWRRRQMGRAAGEASGWQADFRRAAWAGLISSPLVVYTTLVFRLDPFLQVWTAQNLILSPHPLHYLLAYGLLLPLAVVGSRRLLRTDARAAWLLIAWAAVLPALVYAPFNLQRRLAEGEWVVFVALAAAAALPVAIAPREARDSDREKPVSAAEAAPSGAGWPTIAFRVVVLLSLPSTLFLLLGGVLAALQPALPVFRPAGETAAFAFIQRSARPGEIVLAAYDTANALPAWAPVRVLAGHGPESANLPGRLAQVEAFFGAELTLEQQARFLRENEIRFIFWGPIERSLGDWRPGTDESLRLVYQAQGYAIYAVNPERNDAP